MSGLPIVDAVNAVDKLHNLGTGAWGLKAGADRSVRTLAPNRWTRSARRWQSVTPVILDRHPKRRGQEALKDALVRRSSTPVCQSRNGFGARAFPGRRPRCRPPLIRKTACRTDCACMWTSAFGSRCRVRCWWAAEDISGWAYSRLSEIEPRLTAMASALSQPPIASRSSIAIFTAGGNLACGSSARRPNLRPDETLEHRCEARRLRARPRSWTAFSSRSRVRRKNHRVASPYGFSSGSRPAQRRRSGIRICTPDRKCNRQIVPRQPGRSRGRTACAVGGRRLRRRTGPSLASGEAGSRERHRSRPMDGCTTWSAVDWDKGRTAPPRCWSRQIACAHRSLRAPPRSSARPSTR